MKSKLRTCLLVLFASVVAASGAADTKLRLCARNVMYLEDWKRNPLFLVGYNAHNGDVESSIGYAKLLELNARNRINYVRFFPASARMAGTEAEAKWVMFRRVGRNKVDLGKWDGGYWSRVRKYLAFMEDRGIVAHISIFEGCLPWEGHPFNPKFNVNTDMGDMDRDGDGNGYEQGEFFDYEALTSPDATPEQKALKYYQEKMVDKILAETSSFRNVMYEIGNELPNPGIEWVRYWVKFIRDRCDNLITYNGSEGLTESGFSGATPHVHHEGNVRTPFSQEEMSRGRFVASSSDGGEVTFIGSDGGRRCLWKAFTAGIGGWLNYSSDFYVLDAEAFYYSPESPGRYNARKGLYYPNAIGFIHDWGLPFPEMAPAQEVIVQKPEGTEAYCLAGKGEYVIYLCGETIGGRLELDLKAASEHAYWFNPRTGAFFERVEAKPGMNVFSVPHEEQDLVLYAGRARTQITKLGCETARSASPTAEFVLRNVAERLLKKSVWAEYSTDGCETFRRWHRLSVEGGSGVGDPLTVAVTRIPFGRARAARNWVRVSVSTASGRWARCALPIVGADRAWVELSKENAPDGLSHVQTRDGRTVAVFEAGLACRRNADPFGNVPDRYMYFSVDNVFAYAGQPNSFLLTVTYLDAPDELLELQYDAEGEGEENVYRSGGVLKFSGTKKWVQHTFPIDDAYFADRQNAGADFRFFLGEGKVAHISRVELVVDADREPGAASVLGHLGGEDCGAGDR